MLYFFFVFIASDERHARLEQQTVRLQIGLQLEDGRRQKVALLAQLVLPVLRWMSRIREKERSARLVEIYTNERTSSLFFFHVSSCFIIRKNA